MEILVDHNSTDFYKNIFFQINMLIEKTLTSWTKHCDVSTSYSRNKEVENVQFQLNIHLMSYSPYPPRENPVINTQEHIFN